jgi:hypothetical protein
VAEEEKRASKKWRIVEDYQELNKIIMDDVFNAPSVSEIVDIIGSKNKYYCRKDLRQRFHHIPLKVSDTDRPRLVLLGVQKNYNITSFHMGEKIKDRYSSMPWKEYWKA